MRNLRIEFSEYEILIHPKISYWAQKYGISDQIFSRHFKKQFGKAFKYYRSELLKSKINELVVYFDGDITKVASYLHWKTASLYSFIERMRNKGELEKEAKQALENHIRPYNIGIMKELREKSDIEIMKNLKSIREQINRLYASGIYYGETIKKLYAQDNILTNYLLSKLGIEKFIDLYSAFPDHFIKKQKYFENFMESTI